MLKIFFGNHKGEIYNTEVYYANQYDKMWVTDPFAKKVIADIDDSTVIAPDVIQNDIFGAFNSTELSAGVKTLLLIHNQPNRIFNISNCGDNCAKYLLELAENKDIKVCLHHVMDFGQSFAVKVVNDKRRKVITDPIEFLMLANQYLRGETNEG
jgi:phosphatidate phosphatase APP1